MTSQITAIVSGVGFRSAVQQVEGNVFSAPGIKVNIGAATARTLAAAGFNLVVVGRTPERIDRIARDLAALHPERRIEKRVVDILDHEQVARFAKSLDASPNYCYVHSAGLSSGAYQLKDDNPYLPIDEVPEELPTLEFDTVVRSLLLMIRALLPIIRQSKRPRIVVINSMSAIRPYALGYSHSSAKAGLHAAVRALSLELNESGVMFSEVLPGIVDTGLYDTAPVRAAVRRIAAFFGRQYELIPQMSPYAVGEAVRLCLESSAHVLGINMVAEGQWPHQGA